MNMMVTIEDSKDDTRFNPGATPWRIVPIDGTSRVGSIFNSGNEPIGTITANSRSHLNEMIRIIEQAFRERDELLDEVRCLREKERNLNQRRR